VAIKKAVARGCWGGDSLPYVLNPLILLKLIYKFMSGVETDNKNINSKLQ
jgi:hypothetical protein